MFVLAQLIPSPLCTSPEVGSHPQTSRVRFGDRKTEEGDEQTLQRFSDILLGLKKGEWAQGLAPGFSWQY